MEADKAADDAKRNADLDKVAAGKAKVHIDAAKALDKATADAAKKQAEALKKVAGRKDDALAQQSSVPKATSRVQESEDNMEQVTFGQLDE